MDYNQTDMCEQDCQAWVIYKHKYKNPIQIQKLTNECSTSYNVKDYLSSFPALWIKLHTTLLSTWLVAVVKSTWAYAKRSIAHLLNMVQQAAARIRDFVSTIENTWTTTQTNSNNISHQTPSPERSQSVWLPWRWVREGGTRHWSCEW